MSYDNATAANIATLATVSGLESSVAGAWLHCEAQSIYNPTNPLNVRFWGRPGQLRGPGATGVPGVGFASYSSSAAGLTDAWRMLASLAPSYGYGAVLEAAAGSDPEAQARAIELSEWAAGHYGGSSTADGCLRTYLDLHGQPDAPAPTSAGPSIGVPLMPDPKLDIPLAVADIAAGGSVYADPDRTTELIASWAGGTGVPVYWRPSVAVDPVTGRANLACVRVDFATGGADLRAVFVGIDKLSNVRIPGQSAPTDVDTTADPAVAAVVTAAVAAATAPLEAELATFRTSSAAVHTAVQPIVDAEPAIAAALANLPR